MRLVAKLFISMGVAFFCAATIIILYAAAQLPSVEALEDFQLQVPLRIYTADGQLIAEYGDKRRTPITIEEVPKPLIYAVIATEDRRFFEHQGVDIRGLVRAAVVLISRGSKDQGGSTITMQVARNFFLSRKKTYTRKLNEILLAIKIDRELPKEKILELYLNKIYLGKRAYGVAAAAEVYYGKTVDELSLAEMAMIAGLPQAPSAVNPINNPRGALKRRNHVLSRMAHYGFINEAQFETAHQAPLTAAYHGRSIDFEAPYVAEMVRQTLVSRFGEQIYTSGLSVYTTVHPKLQAAAAAAVQEALLSYDRRHGYRGPLARLSLDNQDQWLAVLEAYDEMGPLRPAVITAVTDEAATAQLQDGTLVSIPWYGLRWARRQLSHYGVGRSPESPAEVVSAGHIVYITPEKEHYRLAQIPEVTGALTAINPKDGSILAVVGGFDFALSKFNRATQAYRQPGSTFKPFVYSAALERGYTPASLVNDAPIVFTDPTLEGLWRPQNDSKQFYGPTRLRVGITKSRNLVSIRLLQSMGIHHVIPTIERFGFDADRIPRGLSLALGTMTTTPLELAEGYATFANGGHRVYGHIIHHIEDTQGQILYTTNAPYVCTQCSQATDVPDFAQMTKAQPVISAQDAYIMTHILQDAIQTGTGRQARSLNRRDIAGKTGTTNDQVDAWYSGYNPNLVVTTWMGFDEPRSLREYSVQTALPMWIEFMGHALKGQPDKPWTQPPGVSMVRIDPETGLLARPNQKNAIFEVFKPGQIPTRYAPTSPHTKKHAANEVEKDLF